MEIKKIIFPALLASSIALSGAFAHESEVKVNGSSNFRAAFMNQTKLHKTENFYKSNVMNIITRLKINAQNKADDGTKYGAYMELGDTSGTSLSIRSSYIFTENAIGRLELGQYDSASKQLKIDASDIAVATGGVDGDHTSYVVTNVGYTDFGDSTRALAQYITTPALPLDSIGTVGSHYNKVTYYTPYINGLQFGISYAPDSKEVGGLDNMQSSNLSIASSPNQYNFGYKDVVSAGAKFARKYGNTEVNLSVVGQHASAKKTTSLVPALYEKVQDVKAYAVGGSVKMDAISVAASYGNWGKSFNTKMVDGKNNAKAQYYTVGAAYEFNNVSTSVSYMDSNRMENNYKVASIGVEYKAAQGLLPYAEISSFKFKPYKTAVYHAASGVSLATANKGNVIMVGTKVSF